MPMSCMLLNNGREIPMPTRNVVLTDHHEEVIEGLVKEVERLRPT